MSHHFGKHIGGVRTLEDLRGRCVIHAGDPCWHLRRADGRLQKKENKRLGIHLYGHGSISALQAAWMLATGKFPDDGLVVYRCCESYDCVNPEHLRIGTRGDAARFVASTGRNLGKVERRLVNLRNISKRRKIDAELSGWIRESGQPAAELAELLGVALSTVYKHLKAATTLPRSAFDFRGAHEVVVQQVEVPTRRTLIEERITAAMAARADGVTLREMSKQLGMSMAQASRYARGMTTWRQGEGKGVPA